MEKMIILSLSFEELRDLITECVDACLKNREKDLDKSTEEAKILDVKQASQILGIAAQTLYGLTSRREVPHFKRGKKLYFNKSELLKWIDEGRRKTVKELISSSRKS